MRTCSVMASHVSYASATRRGKGCVSSVTATLYQDLSAAALTNSVRRLSRSWDGVTRFLALTEFARDVYVRAGLDPDRISIKPNFVADPGPRPSPPSQSDVVLFVGRISEEKGADLAAAAWERAAPRGLRLVMIGDGSIRSHLQLQHPHVEFLGWLERDQVRRRLLEARALLFPSRAYEGQSMVLLEAMAAGLPILASDWQPIRETVRGRDPGWLREATNIESWVDGLALVADDNAVDNEGATLRKTFGVGVHPRSGPAKPGEDLQVRDYVSSPTGCPVAWP